MTASTQSNFRELYEAFSTYSIEELIELKNDEPGESHWLDLIIQTKRDELRRDQLADQTDMVSFSLGAPSTQRPFSSGSDRVPINRSNEVNDRITVNGNTPGSLSSPDEPFPNNRTADASRIGLTPAASLELLSQDGLDICPQVKTESETRRVPIKADTDADPEADTEAESDTDAEEDIPFRYLKVDWFDNGTGSESAKGKRVNARHKLNIQFRFGEDTQLNACTAKICAENRYWKRNIDITKQFYQRIWNWYEGFCIQQSGAHFQHKPRLGHIYLRTGDRVEDGVALFCKLEGQPAIARFWLGDIEFTVELDDEAPKGRKKCPALQASFFYKAAPITEKAPLVGFRQAFAA